VDVTAQVINTAGGVAPVLELVLASDEIDLAVLITTLATSERLRRDGDHLRQVVAASAKPLLVYSYTQPSEESVEVLADLGLAWFPSSRRVARAARALADYGAFRRRRPTEEGSGEPAPARDAQPLFAEGQAALPEHRAKALLRRWGFPTPEGRLVRTASEAGAAAAELGSPVALKVQSASVVHKSAAGGVALGLMGAGDTRRAALSLEARVLAAAPGAIVEGFLVERMAKPGVEMILGALDDPDFGPLVMVGMGGVHAEVLADRVFAPAPVGAGEARELIRGLRGAKLLEAGDVEALAWAIARLSQLCAAHAGEIGEIDLNPVIVHPAGHGISVVDATVIRHQP
jgi:acyl-CoA synthetase (NDP forming)